MIRINCVYYGEFCQCNHPEMKKVLWLFKRECIELHSVVDKCSLKVEHPRPDIGIPLPQKKIRSAIIDNDVDLPIGSWFAVIDGWYTVRIRTKNTHNEEIGCGNSQEDAAKEAWEWWENYIKLYQEGDAGYMENR